MPLCQHLTSFWHVAVFATWLAMLITPITPMGRFSAVINPAQYQPERFGVQIASANLVFIYPLDLLLSTVQFYFFRLVLYPVLCANGVTVMPIKKNLTFTAIPHNQRVSTPILKNVFLELRKFTFR